MTSPLQCVKDSLNYNCSVTAPISEDQNSGDIIKSLAEALGLLLLIVIIAQLLMRRDETTLKRIQPGLSLFIMLSFPPLLFKALFEINLKKVQWSLIGAITAAKFSMGAVGFIMGMLSSQGDFGIAGLYAMFMTLGNDIAFGVPLMQGLFSTESKYVNYDLMMCNISEIFFNPICYTCFEIAAAKKHEGGKANGGIDWCGILKSVFEEPMVIFALLGLFANLIFNVFLDGCEHPTMSCPEFVTTPPPTNEMGQCENELLCELPSFIEKVCVTFEGAFNLLALLSLGLQLYGKGSLLWGRTAVMPILLTLIRTLLAPILVTFMVSLFLGSTATDDDRRFSFLYVLIPAGPGTIVMAAHYGLPKDQMAGCIALSTVLAMPFMFAGVAMLNTTPTAMNRCE
jgi:predicted permease